MIKKYYAVLSLLLVFFSGCNAKKTESIQTIRSDNVSKEHKIVSKKHQVKSSTSLAFSKKAPKKANNKIPIKRAPKKNTAKIIWLKNNTVKREDEQQVQTPQPCEGMPSGVKVDPTVQEFLTCEVIQILSSPDSVQSFRVKPKKADSSVPIANTLGQFPIEPDGQGVNLEGANLKKFQKLVFSEKSYHFGMEKRCRFRPDMGLYFVKNDDQAVEILFSSSCNLWLFVYSGEQKLEDFDPIENQLGFLYSLLPPVETEPETPAETSETVIDTSETSISL